MRVAFGQAEHNSKTSSGKYSGALRAALLTAVLRHSLCRNDARRPTI